MSVQELNAKEVLQINVGGTLFHMSRGALNYFPGSKLSWIFNGNWDHILERDCSGNIFLDLNPKWIRPIFQALNRFNEGTIPFPHKSLYTFHPIDDESCGINLCMEHFGLVENFAATHQYKCQILRAMRNHYENTTMDPSMSLCWNTEWILVKDFIRFETLMPIWNPDLIYLIQRGNTFYALVDWNGYESCTRGESHALLITLTYYDPPLVEHITIYSDKNVLSFQKEQSLKQYIFSSRKIQKTDDITSDFIRIWRIRKPAPQMQKKVLVDENCLAKVKSLVANFITPLQQLEESLDDEYYKTMAEIDHFKRKIKFANEHSKNMFSVYAQKSDCFAEHHPADIVNIVCHGNKWKICTNRYIFKMFKDSPLAVKYASEVWEENLHLELKKNGYLTENQNYYCFSKLVDILRMKQIVRFSGYNGRSRSYVPTEMPHWLRHKMSCMLSYFMIEESCIFEALNE